MSISSGMNQQAAPGAEAGVLMALLAVAAGAALIASILYWLMQPTIFPNPGLAGYQAPTPDPVVPRVASQTKAIDTYRAELEVANRENEGVGVGTTQTAAGATGKKGPKSAFARVPDARVPEKRRQATRVRIARTPRDGSRAWAWGNVGWGTW